METEDNCHKLHILLSSFSRLTTNYDSMHPSKEFTVQRREQPTAKAIALRTPLEPLIILCLTLLLVALTALQAVKSQDFKV